MNTPLNQGQPITTCQNCPGPARRHRRRDSWMAQFRGWFANSRSIHGASSPNSDLALSNNPAVVPHDPQSSLSCDISNVKQQSETADYPSERSALQANPVHQPSLNSPLPSPQNSHLVSILLAKGGSKSKSSLSMARNGSVLATKRTAATVKRQRKIRFDGCACILEAAIAGDLSEVRHLVESSGIHLDTCNADGVTALHCAVGMAHMDIVHYLLSTGANINVADDHGWTPLHTAAYLNNLDLVKVLVAHRADVEACDVEGQAPLGLPAVPDIIAILSKTVQVKNLERNVVALYDFDPSIMENPTGDELSFRKHEKITILQRDDPNWWKACIGDREGLVPRQYVQ